MLGALRLAMTWMIWGGSIIEETGEGSINRRPHSSLGYLPPAPETVVWPAALTYTPEAA